MLVAMDQSREGRQARQKLGGGSSDGKKLPLRTDDLQRSTRINISDHELIYFSMGPWDMEAEDPWPEISEAEVFG